MLTKRRIEEIVKIIREHMGAVIYLTTGVAPSDIDIQALRDKGIIDSTVPDEILKDAFVYGIVSAVDPSIAAVDGAAAVKSVLDKVPLSSLEKGATDWLSESAALYCRGLGNRIEDMTLRIVHDAAKEEAMRGKIREGLVEGMEKRQTRSQMITAIRDMTGDMQRDWHRIVNTELHTARMQGVARSIVNRFGEDAFVIVRPNPDACDVCKAAYLEKSGKPIVFRLKDLTARNNIDRTAAELRSDPGLPPLHPHCQCQVFRFDPEIQEIDELGRIVFKAKDNV